MTTASGAWWEPVPLRDRYLIAGVRLTAVDAADFTSVTGGIRHSFFSSGGSIISGEFRHVPLSKKSLKALEPGT